MPTDAATPFPDQPSRALLERLAAGDDNVVEILLQQHLPGLRAFLRMKAGARLLALESTSDLAQSVCRDVLQHLDRFQYHGEGAFRKWLFTTALRKIADRYEYYRAQKRDVGREGHLSPSGSGFLGDVPTPSQHAIANEEARRIDRALADMSDDYREVIVLAKYVGLSRREIAAEMGRSELAVRTLLSRALAQLAEALDTDSSSDANGQASSGG